jgi:hypothetical protein
MGKERHTCRRLTTPIDLHVPEDKFVTKTMPIFAIGSCFATEVRLWLEKNGYNILPVNGVPRWGHDDLAWYNTYSMRDEFRLAAEGRQGDWYFWQTKTHGPQDPFRRLQFGKTEAELKALTLENDARIVKGIRTAELIIITLGLVECWKTPDTHQVVCAWPGYGKGGGRGCRFYLANYSDNYRNVHEMLMVLTTINSNARVILTVSPVQLGATFRTCDQVIANCESKSVLRSVAGAIQRDFGDLVIYFPSYELVTIARDRAQAFAPDGRHVQHKVVAEIMQTFAGAYVK